MSTIHLGEEDFWLVRTALETYRDFTHEASEGALPDLPRLAEHWAGISTRTEELLARAFEA